MMPFVGSHGNSRIWKPRIEGWSELCMQSAADIVNSFYSHFPFLMSTATSSYRPKTRSGALNHCLTRAKVGFDYTRYTADRLWTTDVMTTIVSATHHNHTTNDDILSQTSRATSPGSKLARGARQMIEAKREMSHLSMSSLQ
jgi:hypothetical protein